MSFETALRKTLSFEGGYANSSKDSGGETFRGITRTSNPTWPGWALVDRIKVALAGEGVGPGFVDRPTAWKSIDAAADQHPKLTALVADRYRTHYYEPLLRYEFPQRLTDKMFDIRVNMSPGRGNRILQRAVVASGRKIDVDGVIGPETIGAAKAVDLDKLLANIARKQFAFYTGGVLKKFPNAKAHFRERADWIPAAD